MAYFPPLSFLGLSNKEIVFLPIKTFFESFSLLCVHKILPQYGKHQPLDSIGQKPEMCKKKNPSNCWFDILGCNLQLLLYYNHLHQPSQCTMPSSLWQYCLMNVCSRVKGKTQDYVVTHDGLQKKNNTALSKSQAAKKKRKLKTPFITPCFHGLHYYGSIADL